LSVSLLFYIGEHHRDCQFADLYWGAPQALSVSLLVCIGEHHRHCQSVCGFIFCRSKPPPFEYGNYF
jgi:hypothetical protein